MPIAVFQIYTFCYDRKMLELIQSSLASSSILPRKRRNHAGSELKYSSCSPTLAALLLTLPECGMECHVLGSSGSRAPGSQYPTTDIPFQIQETEILISEETTKSRLRHWESPL